MEEKEIFQLIMTENVPEFLSTVATPNHGSNGLRKSQETKGEENLEVSGKQQ